MGRLGLTLRRLSCAPSGLACTRCFLTTEEQSELRSFPSSVVGIVVLVGVVIVNQREGRRLRRFARRSVAFNDAASVSGIVTRRVYRA